jgi:hypothetical protein
MANAKNKTHATEADVRTFLDAVEHPVRRADGLALDDMFRRVTGWQPRMWGPTIVGYGAYHYVYGSGREGDMCATGFSPRKSNLSLYIMPGYQNFGGLLERLGKHKTGAACLYINKLADVDMGVLEKIVRAGLDDLDARWPVKPS